MPHQVLTPVWQPYSKWISVHVPQTGARPSVAKVAGSPYLKVGVRRRWWVVVPSSPATWLSIRGPAQSIRIWIFNGGWWTVDGTVLCWKEGKKEEEEEGEYKKSGLKMSYYLLLAKKWVTICLDAGRTASWGIFSVYARLQVTKIP